MQRNYNNRSIEKILNTIKELVDISSNKEKISVDLEITTTDGYTNKIQINKEDKRMSINYMNNKYTRDNAIHWDFICLAMRSVADTCIIPVQDYLGLGKEARINVPSTLGTNWTWRMSKKGFSKKMVKKIKMLTKLYGRM